MFLEAGASIAWPTRVPMFKALAKWVPFGIGWIWTTTEDPDTRSGSSGRRTRRNR
jgi:hypothetical protein